MAKGGRHCPKAFSSFSREWGELLLETNFLAVDTSLGHLSMKKFPDCRYRVGPKIEQKRVPGRVATPPPPTEQKLTYFSKHEDDIQS